MDPAESTATVFRWTRGWVQVLDGFSLPEMYGYTPDDAVGRYASVRRRYLVLACDGEDKPGNSGSWSGNSRDFTVSEGIPPTWPAAQYRI